MGPLPLFPLFKKLELEDKIYINKEIEKFPPYSDFNFISLWSYNINNNIEASTLHNNLVVKFSDYVSSELFYSFIGLNKLLETTSKLLRHAESERILPQLKLIPEIIVNNNSILFDKFHIEEDRDNFDYIFHVNDIRTLNGPAYKNKRNKVKRFLKSYNNNVKIIDLHKKIIQKNILDTFLCWEKQKGILKKDTVHEFTAINRLLKNSNKFDLIPLGVYENNKMIGFTITEKIHHDHGIFHFAKADPQYKGIFEFMYMSTAQELYKKGCIYINREQDLGLLSLRESKLSWNPIKHLKKYIISNK